MPLIVTEGPIGAGKTSLSRLLAQELRARLVLEVVEENPFLAGFYGDPDRYAFSAQTFFFALALQTAPRTSAGLTFLRRNGFRLSLRQRLYLRFTEP